MMPESPVVLFETCYLTSPCEVPGKAGLEDAAHTGEACREKKTLDLPQARQIIREKQMKLGAHIEIVDNKDAFRSWVHALAQNLNGSKT